MFVYMLLDGSIHQDEYVYDAKDKFKVFQKVFSKGLPPPFVLIRMQGLTIGQLSLVFMHNYFLNLVL